MLILSIGDETTKAREARRKARGQITRNYINFAPVRSNPCYATPSRHPDACSQNSSTSQFTEKPPSKSSDKSVHAGLQTRRHLQKTLALAILSLWDFNLHICIHARRPRAAPPPAAASIIAERRQSPGPSYIPLSLLAYSTKCIQLAFKTKGLFAFFSELAFGTLGGKLGFRIGGVELIDVLEQTRDLVSGFGEIVRHNVR